MYGLWLLQVGKGGGGVVVVVVEVAGTESVTDGLVKWFLRGGRECGIDPGKVGERQVCHLLFLDLFFGRHFLFLFLWW